MSVSQLLGNSFPQNRILVDLTLLSRSLFAQAVLIYRNSPSLVVMVVQSPPKSELKAAYAALTYKNPPRHVSMFLNILLGYSRVRSSPLLSLRPELKDSHSRNRKRYRSVAGRWSPGGS